MINKKSVTIYGQTFTFVSSSNDKYLTDHLIKNDAEKDILNLLAVSLKDDSIYFDIGANIGFTTIAAANVANKGRLFSFEPVGITYGLLKKNIEENKIDNVKLFNFGLSSKNYKSKISYNIDFLAGAYISDNKNKSDNNKFKNEIITLKKLDSLIDRLDIDRCDLIKVDVEGHEANFLRGSKNFIKKYKPNCIMEVNHYCLNAFARISLPDFAEELLSYFPYVYAFNDSKCIDLTDKGSLHHFYYQNIVNNKYQNVYCGFDNNEVRRNLNASFMLNKSLSNLQDKISSLENENVVLTNKLYAIENSKPIKYAKKLNKVIRR